MLWVVVSEEVTVHSIQAGHGFAQAASLLGAAYDAWLVKEITPHGLAIATGQLEARFDALRTLALPALGPGVRGPAETGDGFLHRTSEPQAIDDGKTSLFREPRTQQTPACARHYPVNKYFLSETAAAACNGLINSCGNLGGFAGPYAVGFLTDETGTYAAGVFYLVGSAVVSGLLVPLLPGPLTAEVG